MQSIAENGTAAAEGGKLQGSAERIQHALHAVRTHLGLQVAYVSRFDGNDSVFRTVDAPGLEDLIKPGDRRSLDDVYCRHILAGRLPELIPDTANEPIAAAMPITQAASIGSHLSVPIALPNGETYGMFCCIGFKADPSLNERDLKTLKAFAEIVSFEVGREVAADQAASEKRARIESAIANENLAIALQPIWLIANVERPVVMGFEALSRFAAQPQRSPDKWFAEAAEIGMGVDLEHQAMRRALQILPHLPKAIDLGINASAPAILDERLASVLDGIALERVTLEITEHSIVKNYDALLAALKPWRERGVRLAVDDAGAGYASMRHVLNIKPDVIKLDMELTRDIDSDPARRALARALVSFSYETGCRIVAEGVETTAELEALRSIGVCKAQGYLLGRPTNVADALRLVQDSKPTVRSAAA